MSSEQQSRYGLVTAGITIIPNPNGWAKDKRICKCGNEFQPVVKNQLKCKRTCDGKAHQIDYGMEI